MYWQVGRVGFQGKGKLSQQNIATKLQTHSESKKKIKIKIKKQKKQKNTKTQKQQNIKMNKLIKKVERERTQ